MGIAELLRDEGYLVVEGKDNVLNMIKSISDGSEIKLCSGYRVFQMARLVKDAMTV